MPTSIKNKFNFTLEQGGNDEVKRPCFSAKAKRGKKKISENGGDVTTKADRVHFAVLHSVITIKN